MGLSESVKAWFESSKEGDCNKNFLVSIFASIMEGEMGGGTNGYFTHENKLYSLYGKTLIAFHGHLF